MNGASSIISIVESLVSQMTPNVTITSNVDNGDGTFTLSMCPTYWLMPNMTISIDGADYFIESFVKDTSITVSGSVQPAVTSFQMTAPELRHGSRRKVNNERKDEFDLRSVWVYLPIPEVVEDNFIESDIAYTADIRPIFLKDYNEQRDTIDLQQDEIIEPLNAAADYFIDLINDDYGTFNEPASVTRREWMNFGDPAVWGNDELIFDQQLSGVEARMSLEVMESGICDCESGELDNCPDVTTSVEGTATNVDTAPGQNIDIQIVDELGNTVSSTLTENTPNTKKLEVAVGSDPVSTSMNGTGLTDTPAGETKAFTIRYEDDSPVTVTTITDTANTFIGEVPNSINPEVYYNRPYLTQTVSYADGDEGWRRINGGNDYRDAIPDIGIIQRIEPDLVNGRSDYLKYKNIWGHYFRFTGENGGYWDEADGNFYDKDGNVSTKAAEFVTYDNATRWLVYDHLTGLAIPNERGGATVWADCCSQVLTYTDFFGAGVGLQWVFIAVSEAYSMRNNNNIEGMLYENSTANRENFIAYSQANQWTGTTRPNATTQAFQFTVQSMGGYGFPGTKTGAVNKWFIGIFGTGTIPQT